MICMLIFIITLWRRICSFHFIDEKIKVQRDTGQAAQGHTAIKWQNQDLTSLPVPVAVIMNTCTTLS